MNEPLRTTLADLVRVLEANHIPHALVGGLAVSVSGHPRMTADVDMIIGVDTEGALELVKALEGTSFEPLFPDVQEVVERAFILPLVHHGTHVKVDLSIGMSGFERQAIARANVQNVLGTDVPVVTAEDLIIMKALAGRPQDDQDLRGLVISQGDALDWGYCETIAAELGEALGTDLVQRIRALRDESDIQR